MKRLTICTISSQMSSISGEPYRPLARVPRHWVRVEAGEGVGEETQHGLGRGFGVGQLGFHTAAQPEGGQVVVGAFHLGHGGAAEGLLGAAVGALGGGHIHHRHVRAVDHLGAGLDDL